MFRNVLAGLFLVGSTLVGCSQMQPAASRVAGARAMEDQFVAAFNRGDAEAIKSMYADGIETTLYPPDADEVKGAVAIRSTFTEMFKAAPGCRLEMTERYERACGNDVVTWGRWKMTIPNGTAAPIVQTGRFTDLKTMNNGKWQYVVDHASVTPAKP